MHGTHAAGARARHRPNGMLKNKRYRPASSVPAFGDEHMRNSASAIVTSHAGRLPVPAGREDLPGRILAGEAVDADLIESAIAEIVRKQSEIGIDCVGDGEFWKARNFAYYGSHLSGIEARALQPGRACDHAARHPRARRVPQSSTATWTGWARCSSCRARSRCRPTASAWSRAARSSPRVPTAIDRELDAFKAAIARSGDEGRGGVLLRDRSGLARSFHLQRALPDRGGIHLRAGRGAAARNIARWSMPDSSCRSTIPGLPDWWDMIKPGRSASRNTATGSRGCASTRSITRSPASRRTRCATICAGAAGTVRTPMICRSSTSPT